MFRNVVNDFLRYGLRSISGMSRKILHPREAQRAFNYLRSGQNSAFLGMVVREGIAYSRRTGRPFSRNKVDWAFMGWEGWKKAFDRARARANRTRNWSSTEEAAAETIFVEKVLRIRKGRAFRPPRVLRLKRGRGGHLLENWWCNLSWREKRVGRIASALVNAPEVLRDVANARKDTTLAVKRLEAGTPHIDSALLSSSWLHSGIWAINLLLVLILDGLEAYISRSIAERNARKSLAKPIPYTTSPCPFDTWWRICWARMVVERVRFDGVTESVDDSVDQQ